MSKLYDVAWNAWHKRAKKRAMKDPVYAEEELGRQRDGYVIGSGEGYTLEGMFAHMDRFQEISPTPWWVKSHHWLHSHGIKAQLFNLKMYHQRGRHGFSDSDLWSFDAYLCKMLSEALVALRDRTHGHPDGPNGFETFEEWQGALTEMAEGFEAGTRYLDILDQQDGDYQKFRDGMELFSTYFFALWD